VSTTSYRLGVYDGVLAGASSPSWFAPGRGTPARRPRSGLALSGASRGQFLVGDAALASGGDQVVQALEGVPLDVALVQAEGELVDVAGKVLFAGVVVHAGQPARPPVPAR